MLEREIPMPEILIGIHIENVIHMLEILMLNVTLMLHVEIHMPDHLQIIMMMGKQY